MRTTTASSISTILNGLIAVCKDGQEGFRSAAANIRNADFKLLFEDLAMQRQEYAGALQRLVLNLGEKPEVSGRFSAALYRGWMDLKVAITSGDDHAILAECERGEDDAVAEYREAIEQDDLPVEVRRLVERQALGVSAAHDRVLSLRDRFEE